MSCACKIGGGPDGVCFECKSRRAFHARLKKLEDKAASDYARGVADERARVVAWLLARAKTQKSWTGESTVAAVLRAEADRIEREKP